MPLVSDDVLQLLLFAIDRGFEGVAEELGLPEDGKEAGKVAKKCEGVKAEVTDILSAQPKGAKNMAWKKGPLPPNTWNWGGVVLVGMADGFYFADFHGDYVVIQDGTPDGCKVAADKIALYDNSLELPPDVKGRALARPKG